ncbi:MAG: hypothetical protein AB7N76_20555 [Planctomycetota bacterium]
MSAPRPSLLTLFLLLGPLAAAQQQPSGRPYYDAQRSLEKQRDAAKEAKTQARSADAARAAALLNDPSVWVRDAVFDVLVERNDAALLKDLARVLGDRRLSLASPAVAELYAHCKFAAGRAALEKAGLRARDDATVLESIWALEVLGDKEAAKALDKVWKKKHPNFRVQGDALIAMAHLDPQLTRPQAEKALEHKALPLRIAALEALRAIDARVAAEAAIGAVSAAPLRAPGGWEARILFAALDALEGWTARAKEKELVVKAIDALIARLDRADGLSRYRCAVTLADLTGESLGEDPEAWRGWWAARKDAFTPKDKQPPAPAEPKKKPRSKKKKKGEEEEPAPSPEPKRPDGRVETGGDAKTRVRFHGIPIHSNRLLFAQDVSGGMNNPMDKSKSDSPSKMAFSAQELKRVLGALSDDVLTNVCFFATEYYLTSERLFPLKKVREKLISFVGEKAVTPSGKSLGRSNLYDTLAAALEDPEVDTVFFLSEGGPTEGQFLETPRFMRHLVRLNTYSRTRVTCLQVTASSYGEKFLRRLAEDTGGEFYDLEFIKKAHGP